MASAARYKAFLRVMEEWPLDKAKSGRDLGAYIRERIGKGFQHGEATEVDPEKCDRILTSLQRISMDHHKKAFPRQLTNNATGLSLEDCRMITSNEALEFFKEYNEGLFSRLKMRFGKKSKNRKE